MRAATWVVCAAMLGCGDDGQTDASDESTTSAADSDGTPSTASTIAPGTSDAVDSGVATSSTEAGDASSDSGDAESGPIECPTAPPFDDADAAIVRACATRIYVEGGDDSRVTISRDAGT